MNNSVFDELRAEGHMVVDFPARKVAVYANTSGQVVLTSQEDGEHLSQLLLAVEDIAPLCAALVQALISAKPVVDKMGVEYAAYVAQGEA